MANEEQTIRRNEDPEDIQHVEKMILEGKIDPSSFPGYQALVKAYTNDSIYYGVQEAISEGRTYQL